MNVNAVRLLEETEIRPGEPWIFVADFNIKHDGTKLKSTDRLDAEIEDIRQIADAGGIVAILAHKGRFKDKDTEDLDFVCPCLSGKLGKTVAYCPENDTDAAVRFVASLKPGDVAVMGNTRTHEGEEKNSDALAERFARLGRRAAIGGFGKAHRAHASNVGLLKHLPGYLPRSQAREMRLLAPWAGTEEGAFSLAVLGGIKKEKITTGLEGFARTYDAVIPGGIVLNTLLKVKGCGVGGSLLTDGGKSFEKEVAKILAETPAGRIHLPDVVVAAKRTDTGFRDLAAVDLRRESVPDGFMIVSYLMPDGGRKALDEVVARRGRMVVAGTPDLHGEGLGLATADVVQRLRQAGVRGIVLGGDTAAEIRFAGVTSTGGGSALHVVAHGTTPVFEALRENRVKFP